MTERQLYLLCKDWDLMSVAYNIKHISCLEDKTTGAYCNIGKKDKDLFVAFKGTELKLNDIITDLIFAKKRIPYDNMNPKIKVHTGFIMQYLSIRKYLLNIVTSYRDYNIVIFGHSLGGALSTLGILDIQYNFNPDKLSGYVFGSPRVGNKEFVRSFNDRVKRFYNIQLKNDWICHLPLKMWGFDHVQKVIKIGKNKLLPEHNTYSKYL